MASTLAGLDVARAGDDADVVDLTIRRILLAHAIVFGWGGVPVIWMGDEIGLPSDPHWADEPGHETDNRWTHRPRMGALRRAEHLDRGTIAGEVFAGLRHLVRTRSSLTLLHAATQARVLDPSDPGVLPVLRSHPEGELMELFNVTESWRPFPAERLAHHGLGNAVDVLSGEPVRPSEDGNVWLAPYRAMWIVADV